MNIQKPLEAAGKRLLDVDETAHQMLEVDDPRLRSGLHMFSKIGDQPQLRMISGAVLLVGTFAGSDRLVRAGARMMLAHELATLAKNAIKTDVDRKRPRSAESREARKPKKGSHDSKEYNSFPSGHTAGTIAVARAFSREFPEYAPAAIGAAVSIAASLVPQEAHYPTDLAAGLAVGLTAEKAADVLWDALDMDERSET